MRVSILLKRICWKKMSIMKVIRSTLISKLSYRKERRI